MLYEGYDHVTVSYVHLKRFVQIKPVLSVAHVKLSPGLFLLLESDPVARTWEIFPRSRLSYIRRGMWQVQGGAPSYKLFFKRHELE